MRVFTVLPLLKPWVQVAVPKRWYIFSDDQEEQENKDLEEEEVFEEENGEEYNSEHDASSPDEEEIPQAERKMFLSKRK